MRDEKLILIADTTALSANTSGTALDLMIGTNVAKYNTAGTDLLGTNGTNTPLAAIIDVGPVTGTSPTCTFTLQCADDSGFTSNVTTLGTAAVTAAGEYVIPFQTTKRFLRLNLGSIGGTSPSFTVSARVGDRPYA